LSYKCMTKIRKALLKVEKKLRKGYYDAMCRAENVCISFIRGIYQVTAGLLYLKAIATVWLCVANTHFTSQLRGLHSAIDVDVVGAAAVVYKLYSASSGRGVGCSLIIIRFTTACDCKRRCQ
jgi:hypothetical protein